MRSSLTLPDGYEMVRTVDLQKDKKTMIFVQVFSLLLLIAMAAAGALWGPGISALVEAKWKLLVLAAGYIAYIILHELTHGVFMRIFSRAKVNYGFTGIYAFAGSSAYFGKAAYIVIALAPVVFWGLVLLGLNCFLDASWFWVIYGVQIGNISGAAGDIYVTCLLCRMPASLYVQDSGTDMRIYAPAQKTGEPLG